MTASEYSLTGVIAPLAQLIALRHAARGLQHRRPAASRASGAGPRRSRFRGRGLDFAEVRSYQPGDDIRHIDWRVTARTGRAHTKVFQEERERPVLIVADLGSSTAFGTLRRLKSVTIAELTALLLWQAHDDDDRVGAIIQGPQDSFAQRPRHDRNSLLRTLGRIERDCQALVNSLQQQAAPPADDPFALDRALEQARRVARPGTRIVLISDFQAWLQRLDEQPQARAELQRPLHLLGRHGVLDVIRVSDRLERSLPPAGRYPLRSGSREQVIDSGPDAQRRRWEARWQAEQARLGQLVNSAGGRLLSVGTEDDLPGRLRAWR